MQLTIQVSILSHTITVVMIFIHNHSENSVQHTHILHNLPLENVKSPPGPGTRWGARPQAHLQSGAPSTIHIVLPCQHVSSYIIISVIHCETIYRQNSLNSMRVRSLQRFVIVCPRYKYVILLAFISNGEIYFANNVSQFTFRIYLY